MGTESRETSTERPLSVSEGRGRSHDVPAGAGPLAAWERVGIRNHARPHLFPPHLNVLMKKLSSFYLFFILGEQSLAFQKGIRRGGTTSFIEAEKSLRLNP